MKVSESSLSSRFHPVPPARVAEVGALFPRSFCRHTPFWICQQDDISDGFHPMTVANLGRDRWCHSFQSTTGGVLAALILELVEGKLFRKHLETLSCLVEFLWVSCRCSIASRVEAIPIELEAIATSNNQAFQLEASLRIVSLGIVSPAVTRIFLVCL